MNDRDEEEAAAQAGFDALHEAWEETERKLRDSLPPDLREMLDRPMYYDPDGNPITLPQWSELNWRKHQEARDGHIPRESWWCRKTFIGDMEKNGMEISTVWLGLDHGYGMITGGPPIIWETMIFGGRWDQEQWRYSTRAQAFDGHERIIRCIRAGKEPDPYDA